MVIETSNGYLIVVTTAAATHAPQPAPKTAAITSQDAQRVNSKEFRDQIREQVRTSIEAAKQAEAQATVQGGPAQGGPAPPPESRTFTIRGRNGEVTTIGMPPPGEIIPPQAVDIAFGFFWMIGIIIIGLPLARAFARRMDRKGAGAQVPGEVSAQLTHLNQAVDAIALEVERISEGQRFTTRLLSEQRDAAHQTLPSSANR
jgi:hypothetical protein